MNGASRVPADHDIREVRDHIAGQRTLGATIRIVLAVAAILLPSLGGGFAWLRTVVVLEERQAVIMEHVQDHVSGPGHHTTQEQLSKIQRDLDELRVELRHTRSQLGRLEEQIEEMSVPPWRRRR